MKNRIALVCLLLAVSACADRPATSDPAEITARSDAWEAALNAPDIDALVELYTADTRVMPPDGEMAVGREAARAAFGAMIDAGLGGTTEIVEAKVSGDVGYIVGTYEITAGSETVGTGKYTEIWRRDSDGQWRIASDIWNDDPAPKPRHGGHGHVVIVHEVEDGERWLSAWRGEDSRHALFKANGAAHVHTMQDAADPTMTALIVAVADQEKLDAMLTSESTMAAAVEDGVKTDTMRVFRQVR